VEEAKTIINITHTPASENEVSCHLLFLFVQGTCPATKQLLVNHTKQNKKTPLEKFAQPEFRPMKHVTKFKTLKTKQNVFNTFPNTFT
jgi:hypothetical protein